MLRILGFVAVLFVAAGALCGCATGERAQRRDAEYLQSLADNGDAKAKNELGLRYQFGRGVERDPYRAAALFREAAEKGIPQAQYNLGLMCLLGEGMLQSDEDAYACFRSAAEQGIADAQMRVAVMTERGIGTKADPEGARKWYRMAADSGMKQAQYIVGSSLLDNPETEAQGKKFIKAAAEQGLAAAQTRYAVLCLKEGTPDQEEAAYSWFSLAAEQDDSEAQFSLGQMQIQGKGLRMKDEGSGLRLVERAAAAGYPAAEYYLGLLYLQGRLVTKDRAKAESWLRRAADHGVEDAATILKDLPKS